jgi:SAM-dependent methyltransferase
VRDPDPAALTRVLELLRDPPLEPDTSQGYLDLIGEVPDRSPGLGQRLMESTFIPMIYERWWRPALGWLAKGFRDPSMAGEHARARSSLELRAGQVVLDLACGPGNFTRRFAPLVSPGGLVVGLDFSPTMLARAMADTGSPAVVYVRGDATALPFRDGVVDAVCCFAAIHLFPDPERALDEIVRVLMPGGRVAIFTTRRRGGQPLRAFDGVVGRVSGMRMFEREELVTALDRRGLVDVSQEMTGVVQTVAARRPG